jgi:UDP-3-O-[3-hydroxymyristoyl] glucosamine N-acyltransferase
MAIDASTIAWFLKVELRGSDLSIRKPASLDQLGGEGLLVFVNRFSNETSNALNLQQNLLVLAHPDYDGHLSCSHVLVANPRLAFARVLQEFFSPRPAATIAATAQIAANAVLGQDVAIGEYTVVGDNVTIGPRTRIANHVVIASGTIIGADCTIKSHSVIGEEGFGFDFDEEGRPVRVPHVGIVEIGDHVEIGALNSIARATLDRTVLGNYVKTDDQVHIAHNARIGDNTLVIAGAAISGSTFIGKGAWIGPNAAVIDKVKVGDRTLIGIGAVVTKECPANSVMAGNPAVRLRERYPA